MIRGLFKKLWAVIGVTGVVFGIITSITGVGLYPMVSGFLTSHRIPLWVYILTVITIVVLVCIKPLGKLVEVTLLRAKEVGQTSSRPFVAQPKSNAQLPFRQYPQQSKRSGEHWAWPKKPDNVFLKFCYSIVFPILPSAFIAIIFYSIFAWILNTILKGIILSFLSLFLFLIIYVSYIIVLFYQNKQSQIYDTCAGILMLLMGGGFMFSILLPFFVWIDGNFPLIDNILATGIDLCVVAMFFVSLIDLSDRLTW